MTNPFRQRKFTAPGAGLVLGTVAIGFTAYLLYGKNGARLRNLLANEIEQLRLKFFTKQQSAETTEMPEYLAEHPKAPKTDREKLLKGEILTE